jgi:hypothetical protein
MTRLVWFVVLIAVVAGGATAAYNVLRYEVLQPVPLAWNHSPQALELLELERHRRGLVARLASIERIRSVGGLHLPLETAGDERRALEAELAALDARIETLRVAIQATEASPPPR